MQEFKPPISKRETEELIVIADDTHFEYWSQEAVQQAEVELRKREVPIEKRKAYLAELKTAYAEALKQEMDYRRTLSFTDLEKLNYIIRWPKKLFDDWYLKDEGFLRKAKQRRILILWGILFWIALGIIMDFFLEDKQEKDRQEIQKLLDKDSAYQELKKRTPELDR